jgi:lipopolysaccharide transport system permease protein
MSVRPTHLVLEPRRGWVSLDLQALWSYRDLLFFLAWRDVKVRYSQMVLGVAWAVIQPVLTMLVFTVFFGRLAKVPSDGIPYPVFAYCALVPWQLFAFSLSESSSSLVANQNLIKKVYCPRLVVPIAACLAGLVDFSISAVVLAVLLAVYGIVPTSAAVFLPLFVLLAVLTALSVGIWLSALNVEYRDVRYTIPFLTQLWLFATPVAYPASLVPDKLRWLYGLNPMAGVVEGFRWSLLGTGQAPGALLLVSTSTVILLLGSGLFYFRRMEETFADVV